jgi:hypothetical protein
MTASVAHPCASRAELLAVLREHVPALASEFKLSSLATIAPRLLGPIHHVVGTDIDGNQGLAFNQNFKCDAIAQVDRNRMQPFKAAP